MMYLVPFFGYMVILILKKWLTHFQDNPFFPPEQQSNGVNIIQVMIGMILGFGKKERELQLYSGQWSIQMVITLLFFFSIPYLLFVGPIVECVKPKGEKLGVIEIFVMNLIHVIEFCLGALSHTASYLRLWALSLAHSQLSHVIWDELFVLELKSKNPALLFISFAGYACLTVAILLGMEAFSALLHAIRLMWVEFSSKFYSGMGVAFEPLSLRAQYELLGLS
jgi:V-type H+-transporting ATPase subunit a